MKYLIILSLLLVLLINVAIGMPPQVGINESNRNAQEKIIGRVVDVGEAPLDWKNTLGIDNLTYFTLRVENIETTSSRIKKGDLLKLVGEYYIGPGTDGIGISRQNLHKDDLIKIYANATPVHDEKGEIVYMPVSGGYSIRSPDYDIPPSPPNQTNVESGNNNAEEIILGMPLVEGSSNEMETIVGDMPENNLEQAYGNIPSEVTTAWSLDKTEGIHRMPDALLQNISTIEPKWRNLTMLLYFNLNVEKIERSSTGIKCGNTIKIAYIGYTYNNFGKEFYRLVNIKGKKVIKIYANATSISNNEGEIFYMPVFGGDSITSLDEIPQTVADIGGKVTDLDQKPIDNATLVFKINDENMYAKTDKNGRYFLKNIKLGCVEQFSVKVQADKYQAQNKNLSLKENTNEIDFILTPEKEPIPGYNILISITALFMAVYIIKYRGQF